MPVFLMSKKGLRRKFPDYKFLGSSTKGLSDVVTTLVIILISLVAIGVVWVVIQNVIQKGSEQVELGQFTLDLQIKAVQVQDENVTIVIVKRNPGEGEFVGMNFIFSDGQNSEIIRENTTLQELDQRSFTITLSEINTSNLKTVSVAPIYMLESGKETQGNLADSLDIPANKSLGTEQNGGATGAAVGNFERLGYKGTGEKTYNIPTSPGEVIKFTSAIVNPLDVLPGDNQTFTVYITSTYEIVKVSSITELDNSTLNLNFEKTSDSGTATVWAVSWIVNDTHGIEYRTNITATDSEGNSASLTLTWTDSCQSQIDQGIDDTISTTCTTGTNFIGGIDGGSLTVAQDRTLTLDSGSKLYFNQGESIIITASGAKITGTGSFGNANLYFYGSGTTATNATVVPVLPGQSPPGGVIRIKDTTSILSCTASDGLKVCSVSCSDPDGGLSYDTGTTVTTQSGACTNSGCSGSSGADSCAGPKLTEYYCSGNSLANDVIDCVADQGMSGCASGACF